LPKKPEKSWGQVINHSSKELLVIENDSGKPIVHRLGPKMKSPNGIDADGFKRGDGESILAHKDWWKIGSGFTANIYQIGRNFLVPISLALPVPDNWFGDYTIDRSPNWGIELAYVTSIIRDKNRKVIGYMTDKFGKVSKAKGIQLAKQGKLDNVDVVHHQNGNIYLRSKRNKTPTDNLG
jgi:hypothetical protein